MTVSSLNTGQAFSAPQAKAADVAIRHKNIGEPVNGGPKFSDHA